MNIENQYLDLLKEILENGAIKGDRTGTGTISLFGRQIRHKMSEGFPLITTKKMYFKGIITELLWFLRGDTNIKYLVDNDCHIWDGDAYKKYLDIAKFSSNPHDFKIKSSNQLEVDGTKIEGWGDFKIEGLFSKEEFIEQIKTNDRFSEKWGELGPIYGKQWRNWETIGVDIQNISEDGKNWSGECWNKDTIDQIANLIRDIKKNPDSRRLIVNAWNVGEIDQMTLPPCHYLFQVYTRELSIDEREKIFRKRINGIQYMLYSIDGEEGLHKEYDKQNIPRRTISLMWNQRSVDTFLGLPFNIASYGLLLEIIAKEVNMIPDELIGNLGDTHLYLNHIDQANQQILRTSMDLPILEIDSDVVKFENDCLPHYSIDNFQLKNYKSHPSIKAPLSN